MVNSRYRLALLLKVTAVGIQIAITAVLYIRVGSRLALVKVATVALYTAITAAVATVMVRGRWIIEGKGGLSITTIKSFRQT